MANRPELESLTSCLCGGLFLELKMLKCNRCGRFDAEDGSNDVMMVTLAGHKSPLTGKHKKLGWKLFSNVAYISCEDCAIELHDVLESYYCGEDQ